MQVEADMRIFIGPVEISGIASNLKEGFDRIGVPSEVVLNTPHAFQYDKNCHVPAIVRVWQKIALFRTRVSGARLLNRSAAKFSYVAWSLLVLCWAAARFDAFVFVYGNTVTNRELELKFLRLLRKRIIFLYVGSDARPPYISGSQLSVSTSINFDELALATLRTKKKMALQENYADVCINSPSSAQFHSRPFVNWFKTGIPKALAVRGKGVSERNSGKVRILHSPSKSHIKGSAEIIGVIEKLKEKGYLIDFIKIEGVPNQVVMDELARCDFVIDQLYSDTPMAVFATEAAHFGKPAVVAGYFSREMYQYLDGDDIPPSLFVEPDQIESAIERLIVDKEFCRQLGQKAQDFVCQKWAPERVAQRFINLVEGKIPDDWWLDPQEIRYVQGCGMPERHARYLVKGLIERYGTEALQLSDKPDVERAFVELAARDPDSLQ